MSMDWMEMAREGRRTEHCGYGGHAAARMRAAAQGPGAVWRSTDGGLPWNAVR